MKTDDVLITSEQLLIGSILIDNDSFDRIELKPHEFISEAHRIIFGEIVDMLESGKPVDLITLAESLDSKKQLEKVGNLAYIGLLTSNCPSSANVKQYASQVRKGYQLRQVKALSAKLYDAAESNERPENIIQLAESELFDLIENESQGSLAHIYDAAVEAIEIEDSQAKGIMSGLRDLDRMLDGFKDSDLIIIAARPSMGKTSLALQIAEYAASKDSVLVFSLEMSKRQLAKRMINYHEQRIGKSQAIAHLKNLNLHIDDKSGIGLSHIRSQCRKIKRQHGLSMIVVDYLQLMQGKGDNRTQEIGAISRGLKSIAKEFDIPVLVLSQLNRTLEQRTNKRPILSDLRESGEIEQDADVVLFIYRDDVYEDDTPDDGLAELICRKYRNGSIGTVYAEFDGQHTRFLTTDRKPYERKNKSRGFAVIS